MLHDHKIIVVLPAYHARDTLEQTYRALPLDLVDEVILVDDASTDGTAELARELGICTFVHASNQGYGANQKTCYAAARSAGADIVVMVHPDYQYEPRLVSAMAGMIASGVYDVVLGSRIVGGGALKGGMPWWKYVANRVLTLVENWLLGAKLSEYHTGYRAYHRRVLESVPFTDNSDDFVFDNEFLAQIIIGGYRVGELSCPTRYFPEASSIDFRHSVVYGLGVLRVALEGALHRLGIKSHPRYKRAAPADALEKYR
ncbi:MAG: glycosyltransferase family 2 protein [Azoarcus sp.]|jgi:glycosyltransferase involved in cell wall biosynthesis|nr:glycosyltransferase family 2 protein [Azoarcus sp.]